MNTIIKLSLALIVAAFLSSSPAISAQSSADAPKTDSSTLLKEKASDMIESGKGKVDTKADNLQKSLGLDKKDSGKTNIVEKTKQKVDDKADQLQKSLGVDKAPKSADELVDVNQEAVTVDTPKGQLEEITTTITPEPAPAK